MAKKKQENNYTQIIFIGILVLFLMLVAVYLYKTRPADTDSMAEPTATHTK